MVFLYAFLAGFLSTLIFHQGLLEIFYILKLTTYVPYSLKATMPFLVPQVISLAFWGGIWGIPLWLIIRHLSRVSFWLMALGFGALGPSMIAWFVVFPLKGLPVAGGWKPMIMMISLIINGVWGIGTAWLMRIFTVKHEF
jgi:hypothetical protein